MVYSTDRSKAVVPVLVLLFVALWFILRGNLFYVLPCIILFLCFSVLLALRLPRFGKRELILVLFVRLFDLCLFGFFGFSSSWCLGRAAVCDCGTPWTFLFHFLIYSKRNYYLEEWTHWLKNEIGLETPMLTNYIFVTWSCIGINGRYLSRVTPASQAELFCWSFQCGSSVKGLVCRLLQLCYIKLSYFAFHVFFIRALEM